MGLTRGRVYQLLNEINDIMTVRWPLGRHQVYELHDKFAAEAVDVSNPPSLVQFYAAVELFYPGNRRVLTAPWKKPPKYPRNKAICRKCELLFCGCIGQ